MTLPLVKYRFVAERVYEIDDVRWIFRKAYPAPAGTPDADRSDLVAYAFDRERDHAFHRFTETEVDVLVHDKRIRGFDGCRSVRRNCSPPTGPRDSKAHVRKFWCDAYDAAPVGRSKAGIERLMADRKRADPAHPLLAQGC